MKYRDTVLFSVLAAFALLSCDMVNLTGDSRPEVTITPDNDAGFVSFTGERQETYTLYPDPDIHDTPLTFNVRGAFEYAPPTSWGTSPGTNTAVVTLPFRSLYLPGTYTVSANGRMGATFEDDFPNVDFDYVPFNNVHTINLNLSAMNPTFEEYDLNDTFTNTSLILPLKGYTVDPAIVQFRTKPFSLAFTADQFLTLATPYTVTYPKLIVPNDHVYRNYKPIYPTAVSAEPFQYTAPYRPTSREFYRYVTFSITYPAEAKIFGVTPEYPIVHDFTLDEAANILRVNFSYYNEPYSGKVVSFWIQTKDGTLIEKIISIE